MIYTLRKCKTMSCLTFIHYAQSRISSHHNVHSWSVYICTVSYLKALGYACILFDCCIVGIATLRHDALSIARSVYSVLRGGEWTRACCHGRICYVLISIAPAPPHGEWMWRCMEHGYEWRWRRIVVNLGITLNVWLELVWQHCVHESAPWQGYRFSKSWPFPWPISSNKALMYFNAGSSWKWTIHASKKCANL